MSDPAIWTCKVLNRGIDKDTLPPGCDSPMRTAVHRAFIEVTGHAPEAIFSGWGDRTVTEHERCTMDGGIPSANYYGHFKEAERVLSDLNVQIGADFTETHEVYMKALTALAEALYCREETPDE